MDREKGAYDLERVIVTGTLVADAPVQVRSGYDELVQSDGAERRQAMLCLDLGGHPYIPASTLRGLVRRRLKNAKFADASERLLGTARRAVDRGLADEYWDMGQAGALRLYDARWEPGADGAAGPVLECEPRIAIDAVTGTAASRHLFTEVRVAAGTSFNVHLEIDRTNESDLLVLLAVLRGLDGGHGAAVGAGQSRMQGVLRWDRDGESIRVLSRERFREWLSVPNPDRSFAEALIAEDYHTSSVAGGAESDSLRIGVCVKPLAPLLVSPERGDGAADRSFQQRDGLARLPASSLKGMLRACARRILLTRIGDRHEGATAPERIAERLVGEVFGSTAAIACLHVGDATGAFDPVKQVHPQQFIAIDEFTGGVADGRLYNVVAVKPEALDWPLELMPGLIGESWALGMLALVLRDAFEGDLALGWGRGRGYGAIRIELPDLPGGTVRSWAELVERLRAGSLGIGEQEVRDWVDALDGEIDGRVRRAAAEATGERGA